VRQLDVGYFDSYKTVGEKIAPIIEGMLVEKESSSVKTS
jgi:hypothetical protein